MNVPCHVAAVWLALVLVLSACDYAGEPPPYRTTVGPPGQVAGRQGASTGRELYLRDCAWCHGPKGEGTDVAPELTSTGAAGAHFYLSTGRMPIPVPQDDPPSRPPIYTPPEILAITAYVASFGEGPQIPRLDVPADLSTGQELYMQNCAACHSSTGIGAALTSGKEAPSLLSSDPTQIAEAMEVGPGTMPVFTFTDEETASVARYVTYLRRPKDRGGAALARLGPIMEGLVAWTIGLGVLLIFVRRIGTRAAE